MFVGLYRPGHFRRGMEGGNWSERIGIGECNVLSRSYVPFITTSDAPRAALSMQKRQKRPQSSRPSPRHKVPEGSHMFQTRKCHIPLDTAPVSSLVSTSAA